METLYTIVEKLVLGYEAYKWLHTHECSTCFDGARALEMGMVDDNNAAEHVCKEALDKVKLMSRADVIANAFKQDRNKRNVSARNY